MLYQYSGSDNITTEKASTRKYKSGALGTLTHLVALHGTKYSNEIVITADGYQLRLVDLYNTPTLYLRYG
jgi:hypothetical protein